MFENIRKDIKRFQRSSDSEVCSLLYLLWHTSGLKTLMVYRMGRWLTSFRGFPLLWPIIILLTPVYWLLTAYFRLAYDIFLEQSAEIGPGFYIGHFGGIRVRNCRIGYGCAIQQEVCLEPEANGNSGPLIGNQVWIGAHSQIKGAVTVGSRATIGAGSLVVNNVAEGCLLLGNPARVVQREYDNSAFL